MAAPSLLVKRNSARVRCLTPVSPRKVAMSSSGAVAMRHHRGATARRRSFKSRAPLWIATEHREQGRADIRQRIEKVRLVPLADVLEQTCWVQNWAVTTMWKEVASATYALGIEVQVDDPGLCFTASLETGTNVGRENPPSAADHIRQPPCSRSPNGPCRAPERSCAPAAAKRKVRQSDAHVPRVSILTETCDPETYACR